MDIYSPDPIPTQAQVDAVLGNWLIEELKRVGDFSTQAAQGRFKVLNVAPLKPREAQIAYADGINWNPGYGKGLYAFNGTYWIPIQMPLSSIDNLFPLGNLDTNPWQRGTSFPAVANGAYTADGWIAQYVSSMVATVGKVAAAPTLAQCGLVVTNCIEWNVTTADAAVAAGDFAGLTVKIEGIDWAHIAQQDIIIPFWHQHTKVGTYSYSLRNTGNDRSYVGEYTQAVSNAWEYAELIIPASPAAGTWDYANGVGIQIFFAGMCGSTFQGTVGAWTAGNFLGSVNQVNAMDTIGNKMRFAIAGVHRGKIAPRTYPFMLGQQVLEYARRYLRLWNWPAGKFVGAGQCISGVNAFCAALGENVVAMRQVPNIANSAAAAWQVFNAAGVGVNVTAITFVVTTAGIISANPITVAAGLVAGDATALITVGAAQVIASAEM